ncbi:MAG: hypothetical protein WAL30_00025 [Candidatus Aquirickettsiella sp.]
MQKEQVNTMRLITMVNKFSGCSIDPKYFPVLFQSPLIIESLNPIYILHQNRKLSLADQQKIKRVFRDHFSFFNKLASEQYSKKYLILSIVFFILLLFSGLACAYLPIVFVPLVFIFCISLAVCARLINIPSGLLDKEAIYATCQHELFALKYNLNELRNAFVDKYHIKTAKDFFDYIDAPIDFNTALNSKQARKTVTFAPKLSVFFEERDDVRSRTNRYENNRHLHPKR